MMLETLIFEVPPSAGIPQIVLRDFHQHKNLLTCEVRKLCGICENFCYAKLDGRLMLVFG